MWVLWCYCCVSVGGGCGVTASLNVFVGVVVGDG